MAKVILRVLFILSVSLNIAFAIHLLTVRPVEPEEKGIDLNLSETQQGQLKGIHLKIHHENEALRKKIAECQKRVMTALKSERVDKEKINLCLERISALQKKIQKNTVEEIIQVKQVLDPHQCNCLFEGLDVKVHHNPCTRECCNLQKK